MAVWSAHGSLSFSFCVPAQASAVLANSCSQALLPHPNCLGPRQLFLASLMSNCSPDLTLQSCFFSFPFLETSLKFVRNWKQVKHPDQLVLTHWMFFRHCMYSCLILLLKTVSISADNVLSLAVLLLKYSIYTAQCNDYVFLSTRQQTSRRQGQPSVILCTALRVQWMLTFPF